MKIFTGILSLFAFTFGDTDVLASSYVEFDCRPSASREGSIEPGYRILYSDVVRRAKGERRRHRRYKFHILANRTFRDTETHAPTLVKGKWYAGNQWETLMPNAQTTSEKFRYTYDGKTLEIEYKDDTDPAYVYLTRLDEDRFQGTVYFTFEPTREWLEVHVNCKTVHLL